MSEVSTVKNLAVDPVKLQHEYYVSKQNILEHQNKKIVLTELMLEMYYKRLEQLVTYNRQKQLEYAQAQQGKFLDIEV